MKLSFCSFFLLGFFFAGNVNGEWTAFDRKTALLNMLEMAKSVGEELMTQSPKFDYLIKLDDEIKLSTLSERVDSIYKKIQKLSLGGMEEAWNSTWAEVETILQQVGDYKNSISYEDAKIRYLALAVLQCYKHDSSIPEAAELVAIVRDSLLQDMKTPDKIDHGDSLFKVWEGNSLEKQSFYIDKLRQFPMFNVEHGIDAKVKEMEIRWETLEANNKFNRAFKEIWTAPPIDSEKQIYRALLIFAKYYRAKENFRRFVDSSEEKEILKNLVIGDKRFEKILLPVAESNKSHSEL